jgi:hypothetical protein
MIKPKGIIKPSKIDLITGQQKLSYLELKEKCKTLGITNSVEYKQNYQQHQGFPAHPERVYLREWQSYNEFFDIPEFISYRKLTHIIHPLKLKNASEYKKFLKDTNDQTFPYDPQGAYPGEWRNWYRFLGKPEPFKPEYIPKEYADWAEKITEFMKEARGGTTKVSHLSRFVRLFIQKYDKSKSTEAFLTQEKFNIKPFRTMLEQLETDNLRRNIIISVNQFLNNVIDKYLTFEDEETGEIVRIMGARNPFELLLTDQTITSPQRSETIKASLQYHFVNKVQKWLISAEAQNFKDLKHIQIFDADWIKVSPKIIDKSDPDCVYKKIQGQYFLWSPVDWLHTYTLTKVPLRGRQIAYNDSGEADELIADIDETGKIIWVKNTIEFAGMTKAQSFIKQMPDGIGMFVTTNKTSNSGGGYSIPWMPEDLAYWLVKLRKWQQKYNPITQATSWTSCIRTSFNETQLKAKGINCFLFRAFGDVEPKNVSSALSLRLAAALHHIQPSNLTLATLKGSKTTLSHYSSKYTPHSMRVSLITAYVMEMGMPIEIVMKVVGHSSVVMSIYYCKISQGEIKRKLEQGEKMALKSQAEAIQKQIEQNKIEEVKNNLIGSNTELLKSLTNTVPAGNFVFYDYGICPFAASRCDDGGDIIGSSQIRAPASPGYLGMQNCLRCRHFITGPAFLGGLLSLTNEVLLESNKHAKKCHILEEKITYLETKISSLDRAHYVANLKGEQINTDENTSLSSELQRLESEYESIGKKVDMLLCDLQSAYKLTRQSQLIINQDTPPSSNSDLEHPLSLLTSSEAELQLELEEVNYYQQLQEVCENATIYQSASAENAILPRTQIIDRMAVFNNIAPSLFLMTEEEQLRVGNELHQLLTSRLKTWDKIEQVINCEIKLDELLGIEKITKSDIQLITNSQHAISVQ